LAEREGGWCEAQPHLDHPAVEQNRNAEQQAPPEADAKHLFVAGVVGAMTRVRRMVIRCPCRHIMTLMDLGHRMVFYLVGGVIHLVMLRMVLNRMLFMFVHCYLLSTDRI
jgi:hypothetical protein